MWVNWQTDDEKFMGKTLSRVHRRKEAKRCFDGLTSLTKQKKIRLHKCSFLFCCVFFWGGGTKRELMLLMLKCLHTFFTNRVQIRVVAVQVIPCESPKVGTILSSTAVVGLMGLMPVGVADWNEKFSIRILLFSCSVSKRREPPRDFFFKLTGNIVGECKGIFRGNVIGVKPHPVAATGSELINCVKM